MTADLVVTDIAATNDPDDLRGIADRAFEALLEVEARNERALHTYRTSVWGRSHIEAVWGQSHSGAMEDCGMAICRMASALVDPSPDTSWARIERALALHTPIPAGASLPDTCTGCGVTYPCPTRRALEGEQ